MRLEFTTPLDSSAVTFDNSDGAINPKAVVHWYLSLNKSTECLEAPGVIITKIIFDYGTTEVEATLKDWEFNLRNVDINKGLIPDILRISTSTNEIEINF